MPQTNTIDAEFDTLMAKMPKDSTPRPRLDQSPPSSRKLTGPDEEFERLLKGMPSQKSTSGQLPPAPSTSSGSILSGQPIEDGEIRASHPGFWQRLWETVAGPTTVGGKLLRGEQGMPLSTPTIDPEAMFTNMGYEPTTASRMAGGLRSAAKFTAGMTSVPMMETVAASGGAGTIAKGIFGKIGESVVSRMVSAGFGIQLLHGLYKEIPEFKKALDRGDETAARDIAITGGLSGYFGVVALKHSVGSIPERIEFSRSSKEVKEQSDAVSKTLHGKPWGDLSHPEREAVASKLYETLKKPSQQKAIKDIQDKATVFDGKAAQEYRNREQEGQAAPVPPRLQGFSREQIEEISQRADQQFPEGRLDQAKVDAAAKGRDSVAEEARRKERGGEGLRDLIAGNRRREVAKAVDKIIESAPTKKPSEGEPVVLEGRPQTADDRFDEMVAGAKAQLGEEDAAEAKRLLEIRQKLLESIRQGGDRVRKEEAERLAHEEEAKPKVADKRRLTLEPLPYQVRPLEEPAILEGRPLDPQEAFHERQEAILEDIRREQAARLAENEARLNLVTSKLKGDIQRAFQDHLYRTSEEAKNTERGFKIFDRRGERRLEDVPHATTEATKSVPEVSPKGAPETPKTAAASPAVPPAEVPAAAPPTKSEQAAPAYAPKPEDRIQGVTGGPYTLHVEGKDYPVVARVVPGDKLKPSHDPHTYQVVPGGISDVKRWGRKIQPRNYDTDKSAQLDVDHNTNRFRPNMVFTDDPTTITGPPIILPDGTVMGGNSRVMTAMRKYANGTGEEYRNGLIEGIRTHANFGINPENVPPEADKPVLVWELQNPPQDAKSLGILADDLNRPPTKKISDIEAGIAVAQRVSDETFDWIADRLDVAGPDATLNTVIRDNNDYLASVMQREGWISGRDRPAYIDDETGELTQKGRELIVNAMFGKVFDDATMLKNAPPGIVAKLERSLPMLLRMKRRGDAWNLVPRLTEAVNVVTSADSIPKSVQNYVHPELDKKASERFPGMKPEFNPIVEALAKKLEASSGLQVKRSFGQYMEGARLDNPEQGMLEVSKPPKPWDSFNDHIGKEFGIAVVAKDWLDIGPPPVEAQNTVVEPPKPEAPKAEEPPPPLKSLEKKSEEEIPIETSSLFIRKRKGGLKPETIKRDMGLSDSEFKKLEDKYQENLEIENRSPLKLSEIGELEDYQRSYGPQGKAMRDRDIAEAKKAEKSEKLKKSKSGQKKALEPTPDANADFRKEVKALSIGELINLHDRLSLGTDPEADEEARAEAKARAKIVREEMDRREAGEVKSEPPPHLETTPTHTKDVATHKAEPPEGNLSIPGMEEAVADAQRRKGQLVGEQLTQAIKTPPTESISKAAGEMERKSPLFGGTEAVTGQKSMWGAENTLITQDEAAKLREAIRKKTLGGGLKAGLDPTVLLDMAKLGLFHFEAGTREFLKWSDRMTEDLGAWARPHMRAVWERMPVIAREEAQRKIKAETPRAEADKIRSRADMFRGIEKKSLGLVDVSGREVGTDVHRGIVDEGARREEPRRLDTPPDKAAERPGPDLAEPHGAGRPAERVGGRELGELPEKPKRDPAAERKPEEAAKPKPLAQIKPIAMEAPKSERPPVVDEAKWKKDLYRWKMPESMPPPTVSMNPTIDAKLHTFQSMLASRAVSTLIDNDAVIIAAPKGSGKTYQGSAVIAEMLDRMGKNKETANVLILAPSKSLGKKWLDTLREFGIKGDVLGKGLSSPEKPGVYTITYNGATLRPGIEKFKWDIVLADESQWARRWYAEKDIQPGKAQTEITRGQMTKELTGNALKSIYVSATPWHTALEIGYMEKLGLWKSGEFDGWVKQFGVTKDAAGNWNVPPNPQRLVKLWTQLVEQGRLVGMEHNLEGQHTNFAMVPLSPEQKVEVNNIVKAFRLAQNFFQMKGKPAMRKNTAGQMTNFMKAYLERTRLPAAIELTKKLNDQGWKVAIFSETKKPIDDVYDFLKPVDEHYGGEIGRLLPKLPGVAESLHEGLEGNIAKYMGPDNPQRTEQLKKFQDDSIKNIFATYAAGGVGVDMHDLVGDRPRAAIYLGPPYSGMMLDQSLGRIYRVGSNSNAYHLFLGSNAAPEVKLLLGKVAPRLQSMRAMVNGIPEGDEMVKGFQDMAGFLQYSMGEKYKPDMEDYKTTIDTGNHVANYKALSAPSAKDSMHKPMQLERLDAPPEPVIATGKEPPKPLAEPKSTSGQSKGGVTLYSGLDPELAKQSLKKTAEGVRSVVSKVSKAIGEELAGKINYVSDDPKVANAIEEIQRIMKQGGAKKAVQETFPSLYDKDAFERVTALSAEAAARREPWNPEGASVDAWRDKIEGLSATKEILKTAFTKDERIAPDVGIYAGMLRSGQHDIMALGGEAGKIIVNDIHDYWLRRGNYDGKMSLRALDILTQGKIGKEEFPEVVRSIVYDEVPANERIAKARDQLRSLFADAIDQANASNVRTEIRDPSGSVRYAQAGRDPNYWPREWDPEIFQKGKKRHEEMVKRLMRDRGLTEYDARSYLSSMRRDVPLAAHLERPRQFDLPDFEMTPEVLFNYIDGWAEARARSEVFGQNREKLQSKILDIKGDEADDTFKRQRAVNAIMDQLLERHHPSKAVRRIETFSSNWVAMAHMTRSMIPMLGHTVKSSMNTSTKAFLTGIVDILRDIPGGMRLAMRSGAIDTKWSPRGLRDIGGVGKPRDIFLQMYGVKFIDNVSRVVADSSARSWMNRVALPALMRDPVNSLVNRLLKDKFQITSEQVHDAVSKKFWSDEALDRAAKRSADVTQGTGDPTELPPWANARSKDPFVDSLLAVWRTTWLLKKYSFRNGSFMGDHLISEARQGNWRPWIPFLMIVAPTAFVVNSSSHAARGDIKYMMDDLKAITGQGDAETAFHHAGHAIGFIATYNYFSGIVDGILNYHSSLQQELGGLPIADFSFGVQQLLQASKDVWEGDVDKGLKRIWNIPTSRIAPLQFLKMPLRGASRQSLSMDPVPDSTDNLPSEYRNQAF